MLIDRRTVILGTAALATARSTRGAAADATPGPVTPAERVLGIGGLFFRSKDPQQLSRWYQVHLGIDPVPTAQGQQAWQQSAGPTAFAPFPMDSGYLGPPRQSWMVNFRVRNLDAMVAQLRSANIEVKVDAERYPNGRFARLHDPEGNPIELWEPASPA
jgi:catechol 2,3-dioxygenase-like lactoylglutathione lyase family enzyme